MEAVEEAREYHNNLLSLFNYTGGFSMKVGKCSAQTCHTFTREAKPKEKTKFIKPEHEFVKYLLSIEDGKIDINVLYKWTAVYADLDKPIISLYDRTEVKRLGKTVDTTIGQLIINRTMFTRFWDVKEFEYVHYMTEKKFEKIMGRLRQLSIEGKVEVVDLKRTVDLYCEIGLRLATIYNAGCTAEMLNTDQVFKDYRDKCINEVKDEVLANGDIHLLEKTVAKIIEFAKKHYADNDMIELYESGGKSSWTGDFASMQIALGGLASLNSDKPEIILQALSDGIPFEYMSSFANTGYIA